MDTDRVIEVGERKFEIKLQRRGGGRKQWISRWRELNSDKPNTMWSFDFDEERFKTSDAALESAVRRIYGELADNKLDEIFTRHIVFGAP